MSVTSTSWERGMASLSDFSAYDVPVGLVCECCKTPAPQFAMELAQDLEAEGLLDEAEDYHQLAQTLLEETGRNGPDR